MRQGRRTAPKEPGLAERGGIAFFWVLNDHCDRGDLLRQLEEFSNAGVEGLVLHPRGGLLVPYGGNAWFELIRWLVGECEKKGIEAILYDEDPYPSGNAGGRIAAEHPEFAGAAIERFAAPVHLSEGELFVFPAGRLCWAGVVFPEAPDHPVMDLTDEVGMIRRHWEKAEWDSRWYYPATPLYSCPRAFAHHAEFAVLCPKVPAGGMLVAFVARTVESGGEWGSLVDTLEPEATRLFLEYTHQKYAATLGKKLGDTVKGMFTDEAKPHANYPWTSGLFASFQKRYGYDLRPRLEWLFREGEDPEGMRVRMDYREWIVRRFDEAWAKPVSKWCERHRLALIGHFSPEEDPVNQAATIGNLFPFQKRMSLSGFDLIIPAIGDSRHPLLNVAAIAATSSSQQNRQPGVCCESLGAFGRQTSANKVARVMAWQIVQGATLGVLHGAFSSQLGLRRQEAPPDYGPKAAIWDSMQLLCRELQPFFKATVNAVQDAPVAILWPIRSFQALGGIWQGEDEGLRRDLLRLMQACVENQIGVHFLDEQDLVCGRLRNGKLCVGKAAYQWILVPSLKVIGAAACRVLENLGASGIRVEGVGESPAWSREDDGTLQALDVCPWPVHGLEEFPLRILPLLPRLVDIPESLRRNFQCSVWRVGKQRQMLLYSAAGDSCHLEVSGGEQFIDPGDLIWFREQGGKWEVHRRFSARAYPDSEVAGEDVLFGEWKIQLAGSDPVCAAYPMGVWQLAPTRGSLHVAMIVTRGASIGEGCVAEWMTYRTTVRLPMESSGVFLWVEPTLMRGRFTLEAGGKSWDFVVNDTESVAQKIDLSEVVRPGEELELCFTLHEPEAMDGIKDVPRMELR